MLGALCTVVRTMYVLKGQDVVAEGQTGKEMYILQKGAYLPQDTSSLLQLARSPLRFGCPSLLRLRFVSFRRRPSLLSCKTGGSFGLVSHSYCWLRIYSKRGASISCALCKQGSCECPQGTMPTASTSLVSENGLFEPFVYNNDCFTKTGSGQTQGKLRCVCWAGRFREDLCGLRRA